MRTTRNKPRTLARRAFSAACIGADAFRHHQIAPDNPGRWRKSATKEDGQSHPRLQSFLVCSCRCEVSKAPGNLVACWPWRAPYPCKSLKKNDKIRVITTIATDPIRARLAAS